MANNPTSNNRDITIRDLYPRLADAELREAEENMERYLELELRVYERILGDPEAYARFKALTASRTQSSMEGKGRAFLNNHIISKERKGALATFESLRQSKASVECRCKNSGTLSFVTHSDSNW